EKARSCAKGAPLQSASEAPPFFRNASDTFSPLEEAGFQVDERPLRERDAAVDPQPLWTERRAIEPGLPPDHPLEPGSRETRPAESPAERIAASESALIGTLQPPATEAPAKSNFI